SAILANVGGPSGLSTCSQPSGSTTRIRSRRMPTCYLCDTARRRTVAPSPYGSSMDTSLKGRRALVCGATQGIGRAGAFELAGLGAECVLLARNEEELKKVVAELPRGGGQKHSYLVADFTQPETVSRAAGGTGEIHILVNNTGGPKGGPALAAG